MVALLEQQSGVSSLAVEVLVQMPRHLVPVAGAWDTIAYRGNGGPWSAVAMRSDTIMAELYPPLDIARARIIRLALGRWGCLCG